jgi:hypothetical protein
MKRQEAIAQGLTTYRTGKRCKWGHDAARYASSGACVTCMANNNRGIRAKIAHAMLSRRFAFVPIPLSARVRADKLPELLAWIDAWNMATGELISEDGGARLRQREGVTMPLPASPPEVDWNAPGYGVGHE